VLVHVDDPRGKCATFSVDHQIITAACVTRINQTVNLVTSENDIFTGNQGFIDAVKDADVLDENSMELVWFLPVPSPVKRPAQKQPQASLAKSSPL